MGRTGKQTDGKPIISMSRYHQSRIKFCQRRLAEAVKKVRSVLTECEHHRRTILNPGSHPRAVRLSDRLFYHAVAAQRELDEILEILDLHDADQKKMPGKSPEPQGDLL